MDKLTTQEIQLIQVDPNLLKSLEEADRSEWDQEQYIEALKEAVLLRSWSQWVIGKLAFEMKLRWKEIKDEDLAKQINLQEATVRIYRLVFERFYRVDPEYVPTGYIPFEVLKMVAQQSKGKNPIDLLNKIEDEGANKIGSAYRVIKEDEANDRRAKGEYVPVVPPKPPIPNYTWTEHKEKWSIRFPKTMTLKAFQTIDWTVFDKQRAQYLEKLLKVV